MSKALFVGVAVFAILLLAPGRGPFAADATQGDGRRKWLTVSRDGVVRAVADADDEDSQPT